jgi:Cyclin, N-terminal domain
VLNHKITLDNRAKMVDWMVQVYKVMGKSCPLTFFLGVSIMDRYFIHKSRFNQIVNKSELHIIGLCSLHISSKFEDVIPIYMSQVLLEIAHGKFSRSEVMDREFDILKTISFKIKSDNIYEEAMIIIKKLFYARETQISKSIESNLMNYITFLS